MLNRDRNDNSLLANSELIEKRESYLNKCLGSKELRPSLEIYNQMQFFNEFKYFAITTETFCKIYSMDSL